MPIETQHPGQRSAIHGPKQLHIWRSIFERKCCCTVTTVLTLFIDLKLLTVSLSLINMYSRTNVHVAPLHTTLNQPTSWPHSNQSPHTSWAALQSSLIDSRANLDSTLPKALPKQHQAQNSSQTINHAWSSSKAINSAWSSSETITLSLDITFQQLSYPAASHPVGITLQSGVPRPPDIFDLNVNHCPQLVICGISWFWCHWLGQSAITYPYAELMTTWCVLLQLARSFSWNPHVSASWYLKSQL